MPEMRRQYRTIKALVFDCVHLHSGLVDYQKLTEEVLKHFPRSRWKKSHWAWYKHQILSGRFKESFSQAERQNIRAGGKDSVAPEIPTEAMVPASDSELPTRGPAPKDPVVKQLGDEILDHVRFVLKVACGDDADLRFKLNRWVFSRLMQEEIRLKRPIKKALWESGMKCCQECGQSFSSLKGVQIHRKDSLSGYSVENCELLCRECHQELERSR